MSRRTYYIDAERGDDGKSGLAPGAAWQSLDAIAKITPGDCVSLRAGCVWDGVLHVPCDRVSVSAYGSGSSPIINGDGHESCVRVDGKSRIRVSGIETYGAGCGVLVMASQQISITGCSVHHNTKTGMGVKWSDSVRVLGCRVFENGIEPWEGNGIGVPGTSHITIVGNEVHSNRNDGIDVDGFEFATGIVIAHNRCYGNGTNAGFGISIGRCADWASIHHNVCYGNYAGKLSCGEVNLYSPARFFNNTIWTEAPVNAMSVHVRHPAILERNIICAVEGSTFQFPLWVYGDGVIERSNHNLFYDPQGGELIRHFDDDLTWEQWQGMGHDADSPEPTDPLFVDAPGRDFRLRRDSPAWGLGAYASSVSFDFNSIVR